MKADYSVTAGIMELPSGQCFEVGSTDWWNWINSDKAESFRFECDYGVKGYRARKEVIKSRSGSFWYAYKRVDGKLRKKYLGKSDELTLERLESAAYDLAKATEPREPQVQLPNKSVGNYSVEELQEALREQRANAIERENCYQQLLEQKIRLEKQAQELQYRCTYLENENNRLTKLGQDYSQATVAKLNEKYAQAIRDSEQWKESSESYKRQAAKLREELHNTLGNQQRTSLDGLKVYKLHGREVVRLEDLLKQVEV